MLEKICILNQNFVKLFPSPLIKFLVKDNNIVISQIFFVYLKKCELL